MSGSELMALEESLIGRVARALHEAMRHSPVFADVARGPWDSLKLQQQCEYRAVTHSALIAARPQAIWVVTDESDRPDDERHLSSVLVVAESKGDALAYLKRTFDGAETCVWKDQDGEGWHFTTMYSELPWTMQRHVFES